MTNTKSHPGKPDKQKQTQAAEKRAVKRVQRKEKTLEKKVKDLTKRVQGKKKGTRTMQKLDMQIVSLLAGMIHKNQRPVKVESQVAPQPFMVPNQKRREMCDTGFHTDPVAIDSFNLQTFMKVAHKITVGNVGMFPSLALMPYCYETSELTHLEFFVVNSNPTTSSGTLMIAVDPNITDTGPTSWNDMAQMRIKTEDHVSRHLHLKIPLEAFSILGKGKIRYNPAWNEYNTLKNVQDPHLSDFGWLYVTSLGLDTTANPRIYVRYRFTMRTQQPTPPIGTITLDSPIGWKFNNTLMEADNYGSWRVSKKMDVAFVVDYDGGAATQAYTLRPQIPGLYMTIFTNLDIEPSSTKTFKITALSGIASDLTAFNPYGNPIGSHFFNRPNPAETGQPWNASLCVWQVIYPRQGFKFSLTASAANADALNVRIFIVPMAWNTSAIGDPFLKVNPTGEDVLEARIRELEERLAKVAHLPQIKERVITNSGKKSWFSEALDDSEDDDEEEEHEADDDLVIQEALAMAHDAKVERVVVSQKEAHTECAKGELPRNSPTTLMSNLTGMPLTNINPESLARIQQFMEKYKDAKGIDPYAIKNQK